MSAEKELTDGDFDETIKSGVCLVDFWAPWCGPCRMQGPILEKLAETYGDKVTIGKLEVDGNPQTASKFSVMSIPTLILFKDGVEVQRFVWVQDGGTLSSAIDSQLS